MNPIPWQPVELGVEAGIGAVYLVRPSSGLVYAAERLQPNSDGVSLLADEDGDMLGGVTFRRMQDKLRARILSNEAGHITGTLGRPMGAPGIECESRAFWYPKPLLLVALAALAFAATGPLQAQLLDPIASPRKLGDPVRPTQPAITCTTGRAALIGHAGRQAATIEMAVALGVAYVVLGGAMLASVASFRLLSDKIDSFFALLIPKPADIRGFRNVPFDEGFSPFKFEQVRKPRAKLKSSDLASGRPPVAATSPKVSIPPALEVLQPFPPSQADQLRLAAPRESPACVTGATLSLHDIAPHFQRADRKNKSQARV